MQDSIKIKASKGKICSVISDEQGTWVKVMKNQAWEDRKYSRLFHPKS